MRGVAAAHAHPVPRLVPVHQQQHVGITVLCNTREAFLLHSPLTCTVRSDKKPTKILNLGRREVIQIGVSKLLDNFPKNESADGFQDFRQANTSRGMKEESSIQHIYISIQIVLFLRYKTDQQERGQSTVNQLHIRTWQEAIKCYAAGRKKCACATPAQCFFLMCIRSACLDGCTTRTLSMWRSAT